MYWSLLGLIFIEFLSSTKRPARLRDPLSLLVNGTRGSFPGGKADHSSLYGPIFKKEWTYTYTPPTCL